MCLQGNLEELGMEGGVILNNDLVMMRNMEPDEQRNIVKVEVEKMLEKLVEVAVRMDHSNTHFFICMDRTTGDLILTSDLENYYSFLIDKYL